jgi:hypothetical protein
MLFLYDLCCTLADDDAGRLVLPVVTCGMIDPSAGRTRSLKSAAALGLCLNRFDLFSWSNP